jgi:hypothetical protein
VLETLADLPEDDLCEPSKTDDGRLSVEPETESRLRTCSVGKVAKMPIRSSVAGAHWRFFFAEVVFALGVKILTITDSCTVMGIQMFGVVVWTRQRPGSENIRSPHLSLVEQSIRQL